MSLNSTFNPEQVAGDAVESKTCWKKLKHIAKNITVEPLVFGAFMPSVMNYLTTQNLNLEKACRVNLLYNRTVCDAMLMRDQTGYEPFQEEEVQKIVSNMLAIKLTVTGSYSVFLMLFIGSWSDRHGRRRPLILMPVLGELIGSIFLLICSYFFLELSVEYSMLAETIPLALGGTWACGFLGIYTYVSGLCSDENKTVRIGVVTMCQGISIPLGYFLSGILLNLLGFLGVYTLSIISLSCSLIYGVLVIKEEKIKGIQEDEEKCNFFKDFFALQYIKSTFKICFKKGTDNRRSKMIVLVFLSIMILGPSYGEMAVAYLYVRIKCGWDEIDYSIYSSLHSVIQIFGSSFALAFFSKCLKMDDAMLGIIAITTRIAACLVFAFANSGIYFYTGAIIEVFHGTCHIAMRSLMAKVVPPHELGRSNSLLGVSEAITSLVFGTFYSMLYSATITYFSGTVYLVTSGFCCITLYLYFWMYRTHKKDNNISLKKEEVQI